MYKIPVFAAVIAALLLILVMSFRYEIHLPFFKIRPSTPQLLKQPEPVRNLLLEDSNEETIRYQRRESDTHHRGHSRVQALEETKEKLIDDCIEDVIDIAAAVEELGGSRTSDKVEERKQSIVVTTTRTSFSTTTQVLSEDSSESLEKVLEVENQSEEELTTISLQERES